jgi:hypothetical protein
MNTKITGTRYKTIDDILRRRLPNLGPEDSDTRDVMRRVARVIRKKGYIGEAEFRAIWEWKNQNSRFVEHIRPYSEDNTHQRVLSVSQKVLATADDLERIQLLDELSGVAVPTASAILMFIDPQKYGVVDMHIWRLFYEYGLVKTKPEGQNLDHDDWLRCTLWFRDWSATHSTPSKKYTARDIERVLFEFHGSRCR